ncbi:MAG: cytochrome c [Actinomycetia bacterium]|nr:cytochrome c [Actinomycetes bacterium]
MLSKSQAKWFLILATVGFSFVFLFLTFDTIRQVDARTNADALTEEVEGGREIWDQNNCMGCHTILGEGAYYAPELTKVVDRRGEVWIRTFLRDPEAMFPGRRKMIDYDFTEDEITDVIAFLAWIGEIDTNDWPPEPNLAVPDSGGDAAAALANAPAMVGDVCQACHSVGGVGGNVGPALDGVADRFSADELDTWLADPTAVKPGTAMPNLKLDDVTRAELVEWLLSLD